MLIDRSGRTLFRLDSEPGSVDAKKKAADSHQESLGEVKPTSTRLLPIRPLTLRGPERSRGAFPEPTAAKKYFRSSFPLTLTGSSGKDK